MFGFPAPFTLPPPSAMLRAALRLVAIDELSLPDRAAATLRLAMRFGPLNMISGAAMAAVYAYRFDRPSIMVAAIPIFVAVLILFAVVRRKPADYWQATPVQTVRVVNAYALGIGLAWFILIGALNTVPLSEDRVGISCANVGVICLGGMVVALLPEAALIFMVTVGVRLTIDLAAIVAVPPLYVLTIAILIAALESLSIGQARLFADRTRAGVELAALEARRIEDERRAAQENRAREREHERRRADELQQAAERQRATMDDHAQRFETSVVAVVDILSGAVRDLGGSTANLANLGKASSRHVAAVRDRALTVAQSMADVQQAAAGLRAAIAEISREVAAQVEATADAETVAALARAQARELSDSSAMVRGITAKIERIAQRTNTLALNALIEATQSGEAGAGFAVVAGEVKALAAQTRAAALEIGTHIADMDANAGDVAASVDAMANNVGRIAVGATDIARAVEAQRSSTVDIFAGVDIARDGAQMVQTDLQALADQAKAAIGLADIIERVATDISVQSNGLGSASADFGNRLRRS